MASIWTVRLHSAPIVNLRSDSGIFLNCWNWNRRIVCRKVVVKAVGSDDGKRFQNDAVVSGKSENATRKLVAKFHESIGSLPAFASSIGELSRINITIGFCIVATIVVLVIKRHNARKSNYNYQGSVADLVRRGQIRSDRRGISAPLKYEDPFNNPMVKMSKTNSTVEMCGKVYRLAPVALTDELKTSHQKRRSRAYQWKRPKVFLKEGEPIPPDVDPDTIRWIPANHPFATTSSDIDEDLAQNNVYQKHGVPFRIKAEHEALQRKLEALQNILLLPETSRGL
ncbi:protein MULTIPLE CHLOROPLAST DIVISION SITE 1 isoform X2 [Andrographis paniculata]|uniref:protein MULTIPLE CHLOROPLAST DIVISION SITE 1 isoform X2 n=1 Tax=Andrographis paniculata TaxID=175694 RepID=UPI0021E93029|nr:protein MULTIPLE CHLOROPLAST DIVISION SITE 1 isoform X2 [Andrographis paniculata]